MAQVISNLPKRVTLRLVKRAIFWVLKLSKNFLIQRFRTCMFDKHRANGDRLMQGKLKFVKLRKHRKHFAWQFTVNKCSENVQQHSTSMLLINMLMQRVRQAADWQTLDAENWVWKCLFQKQSQLGILLNSRHRIIRVFDVGPLSIDLHADTFEFQTLNGTTEHTSKGLPSQPDE